jgi:hypothetical protein
MKLIDQRIFDGSRHFAKLPKTTPWEVVEGHVLLLEGAKVVNAVSGTVATPWLDFTYRDQRFLVHSHENELHLFVRDPQCSDVLLYQVGAHFERLNAAG